MNFREHKDVKARVIHSINARDLEAKVNKFCNDIELVDLQYSTHGYADSWGNVRETWSVLILYKEKEIK